MAVRLNCCANVHIIETVAIENVTFTGIKSNMNTSCNLPDVIIVTVDVL